MPHPILADTAASVTELKKNPMATAASGNGFPVAILNRNEPAFVKSTLLKLAKVRGEDPEHFSSIIWKNTCKLYDISIE